MGLSRYAESLNRKPVAVFGLGLSGLSVVRALVGAGIAVTAGDDKPENCEKAKALGAQIEDLTQIDLSGYGALVLAPGVPYSFKPHPVVLKAQADKLEIIGDLELLDRAYQGVKTIGITGTNGKSTTTALMTHVLNECGVSAVMGGNIGKPVFDLDVPSDDDILVLEISSYQMDLCPHFRPDISVLLNITPDHLDRHGSMDSYMKAKERILEGEGVAVVAVDDDGTQKLFEKYFVAGNRKIYPVSSQQPVIEGLSVRKGKLIENKKGVDRELADFSGLETLRGVHNHQNAICVYQVARELSIEHDKIISAFGTYAGLAHRQYLVRKIGGVTYINDSKATNAEAAARALSSYDNIYWILGGLPKENGLRGLGEFKSKIKKAYLIGQAAKEFAQWFEKHDIPYEHCDILEKATQTAHREAQGQDEAATVLLSPACASWDQYPSFEGRGDVFVKLVEGFKIENKEAQ